MVPACWQRLPARVDLSPQQRKTALLFQNYMLFPNLTVAQNVAAGIAKDVSPADRDAMVQAARKLCQTSGVSVLAKGGHFGEDASDLLVMASGGEEWFAASRIDNPNTHGTGTLSSAIASNLAKGYDLKTSVGRAKSYLTGALLTGLDLGAGSGPLSHGWNLQGDFCSD